MIFPSLHRRFVVAVECAGLRFARCGLPLCAFRSCRSAVSPFAVHVVWPSEPDTIRFGLCARWLCLCRYAPVCVYLISHGHACNTRTLFASNVRVAAIRSTVPVACSPCPSHPRARLPSDRPIHQNSLGRPRPFSNYNFFLWTNSQAHTHTHTHIDSWQ